MCGLVGMLGLIDSKEKKAFKDLLRIDQVRGSHSVGVYSYGPNTQGVFKKALSPDEMFSMKGWTDLALATSNLYIGHNRYATQGAINGVNAHPFEIGDIVGAHNGTLRQQSLLPDHTKFEVDSENIMHSLNKDGTDKTIKNLNGAYALTWFDTRTRRFHMIRNAERPLFYCFSVDHKTMFWASEEWMLYGALGRQGVQFTKPKALEIHKLYSIDVPNSYAHTAQPLGVMSKRDVKPYTRPPVRKQDTKKQDRNNNVGKHNNIVGMPYPFTGKDKVKNGDTVYFWQGTLDPTGRHMSCPVESDVQYDARVHFGSYSRTKEMLMDDAKADSLFEAIVCGSVRAGNGEEAALIVNPNTVKEVDAKKQEELLLALTE